MRDQIYVSLDLLSGLPPQIANSVAEQIVSGVSLLLERHHDVVSSQTEWNLVLALARSTIAHPEAARSAFDLLNSLTADGPKQRVSADNFNAIITLLDEFATTASLVVEAQPLAARRKEPLTSSKYV